jgi:hypothetical protein
VEWSERGPVVFTNDSTHLPPPWTSTGPNHPSEEGTAMNISLGYEILPLCTCHPAPCLPVSIQTWFNILPPTQESHTGIGLLETLPLNFTKINNTSMGKLNLPICETISYKHWKYSPPHWSNCCASTEKLLVSTHNLSFIDWGPHGRFVHNCPEDWNRIDCDYINKIVWQNGLLHKEHYMKGLKT